MKNRFRLAAFLLAAVVWSAGCAASEYKETDPEAEVGLQENDEYEVDSIELTKAEKQEIEEEAIAEAARCAEVYGEAVKDKTNVLLSEDTVHEMVRIIGEDGFPVTCRGYDHNMLNYEEVDAAVRRGAEGEKAETALFELTDSGVFRFYKLEFAERELTVSMTGAVFDENGETKIQMTEKFRVYDWEYTQKGWLIWEKALSRNPEMDMHNFIRILPLDEICREMADKYILPVSYFCNNLFLEDWNENDVSKIVFNDLFEFLYNAKNGEMFDAEMYEGGVPEKEFEDVIQTFFDIPSEKLKEYAGYDSGKGTYPFEAVGPWNRARQIQPFPEVVKCEENGDGTVTLFVEAVFIEAGTDCSFSHEVTMRKKEGRWVYAGNKINQEASSVIPGYERRTIF